MNISVFTVPIVLLLLISGMALGYFRLYTGYINRTLAEKGRRHRHMIPPCWVVRALAVLFIVCVIVLGAVYLPGMSRLTTARDMEEDMRGSQRVDDDWNVEIAMSDDFAALIAYDDEQSDHTFAVYRNDSDTFTDYKFRYGGHITSVERSVCACRFDGALILLSMNVPGIEKVECYDGETYKIDPDRPFVLILPDSGFDAYDAGGNRIDLTQDPWYEERSWG